MTIARQRQASAASRQLSNIPKTKISGRHINKRTKMDLENIDNKEI